MSANAASHVMQYGHQLTQCFSLGWWPFLRCFPCSALSPVRACGLTFSDPLGGLPSPDKVVFWGGGGAVRFRATREERCTLLGGVRGAPPWGMCFACSEAGSSPLDFGACLVCLSLFVFLTSACAR